MSTPDPAAAEPRLAQFLQKAGILIAQERGVTPKARVLLESLARDLELAADQKEFAFKILQQRQPTTDASIPPQLQTFRDLLRVQLQTSGAKIISAKQSHMLLTLAERDLQLAAPLAEKALHEVCTEFGVKHVARGEAERFLAEVIEEKLEGDEAIELDTHLRLLSLGQEWGLDGPAIDHLINERLLINRELRRARQRWLGYSLASGGVAVALLAGALIFAMLRPRANTLATEAKVDDASSPTSVVATVQPPAWWTVDLTVAMTKARREFSDFAPIYDALAAAAPARRSQGYELLLAHAFEPPFRESQWRIHANLLRKCLVAEPDREVARALGSNWNDSLRHQLEQVPLQASGYQAIFLPLEDFTVAITDAQLPPDRATELRGDWEALTQTTWNAQSASQVRSLVAVQLLKQLGPVVEKRANVLTDHYTYLASVAREHAANQLPEIQAALCATGLSHASASFPSWRPLAEQAIAQCSPLALLQVVAAWDHCPTRDTREEVTRLLAARLKLPSDLAAGEYPARIHAAVGSTPDGSTSVEAMWTKWRGEQISYLDSSTATNPTGLSALEMATDAAWRVNLTLLLRDEPPRVAEFQELSRRGLPAENAPAEKPDADADSKAKATQRLSRDQQETLERYATELGRGDELEVGRRVSYLRGLAKLSEEVSDIPYSLARPLATYLLRAKGDEERDQVELAVARLRRWRQLRLAVADGLETSSLTTPDASRLIALFTGSEITGPLPQTGRRLLLESVARELPPANREQTTEQTQLQLDSLLSRLRSVYEQRCDQLGISKPSSGMRLSAYWRNLVSQRLTTEKLPSDNVELWSRTMELIAATSSSDVHQTLLYQRLYVEIEVASLVQQAPTAARQASESRRQFLNRAASTPDIFQQLLLAEQTILKLLLLRN